MSNHWKAALFMVGAMFSFTFMAVTARELGQALYTYEIMMYRSFIGIIIMGVVVAVFRAQGDIRMTHFNLHIMRNIFHFGGQNLWFYAVLFIPLSQLFAFEFATPLWIALLAPLFLGERLSFLKAISLLIGFIGILIVARPDVSEISLATFAAFTCAIGFAATSICTKSLTKDESLIAILFWLVVLQAFLGLLTCLWFNELRLPLLSEWPYLIIIGCCGLLAHFCLTSALQLADATFIAPLEFLRLPLIAIVGFYLYQEPLLWTVFAGSFLIFGANYLNILASLTPPIRQKGEA